MNDLLIKLFECLHVNVDAEPVSKSRGHVLNAEVAAFGYTLAPDLIKAVSSLSEDAFIGLRGSILNSLGEISGANVRHQALFKGFPYSTPDQFEYMHKRVMQHVQNTFFGRQNSNHLMLSCGHVIDPSIFPNVEEEFGSCPVCQFQVDELEDDALPKHDFNSITPLKVLHLADDAFITKAATQLVARNSSLSVDERRFVLEAVKTRDIAIPNEVYRENLPLAYLVAKGDVEKVRHLFKGATDVLRIATFLSDNEADLSLSVNTRLSIKRGDAKRLLDILNGMPNAAEDMLRHREKWKRLLHAVHAGSEANRKRYPNATKAADIVRSNGEGFTTFNAKSEQLTRSKTITGEQGLASLLTARPGDFIRKLDFMLLNAGEDGQGEVLANLTKVVGNLSTEVLFTMCKYLPTRVVRGEKRTFIPKGVTTKAKVVEDKRQALNKASVEIALADMGHELHNRFSAMKNLGKVYIDPILFKQLVPFNRRADSSTSVSVVKGSRYPLGDAPVIRLFTWWKGNVDVDLSAVLYDANFDVVDSIYYGDLANHDLQIQHSGDIQNAPDGAAEFVDFVPNRLREMGVRYVLSHLISFRRDGFNTFPCFAGFMERDSLRSGRKFEPESVHLKFDVNTPASEISAHIFDLETNEVIFADLTGGTRIYNNVSKSQQSLQEKIEAILSLPTTKTTLGDVLMAHATARGSIVDNRFEADTIFDLETVKGVDVMSAEQMGEFCHE